MRRMKLPRSRVENKSFARDLTRAALFLALILTLTACHGDPLEQGLAAKVNGKPIPLRTLEFVHGLRLYSPPVAEEEALSKLKADYGEALAGLVVEELVNQELAKRDLAVSAAELKSAETAAREGYTGETFEVTLSEEGIELDVWRERLRVRVAMDKFATRVLRPRVSITSEEAQLYYKKHAQEFALPARIKFIRVESKNAEALRKALDAARQARDPADLLTVFDDVTIQTQASPEETLPRKWREALKVLNPGQAGQVTQGGIGYQAFILLDRSEAKVEGLMQVYPLVEKRLAQAKLAQEFSLWLTQALNTSVIEISPGLVPQKGK